MNDRFTDLVKGAMRARKEEQKSYSNFNDIWHSIKFSQISNDSIL